MLQFILHRQIYSINGNLYNNGRCDQRLVCVRQFVVLHCGCLPPNVYVFLFGDIVGASPPILCVRLFVVEHCGCIPPIVSVEGNLR